MREVSVKIVKPHYSGIFRSSYGDRDYAEVYCQVDLTTHETITLTVRTHCSESNFPYEDRTESYRWLKSQAMQHCLEILQKDELDCFTVYDQQWPDRTAEVSEPEQVLQGIRISGDLYSGLLAQVPRYQEAIKVFEQTKRQLLDIVKRKPNAYSDNEDEARRLLSYLARLNRTSNSSGVSFDLLSSYLREIYERKDTKNHNYLGAWNDLASKLMWLETPSAFYEEPTPYPEQISEFENN